jgi:GxxExxY protein
MKENEIGGKVVDCAIAVHRELGPGLLEVVYEAALAYELTKAGVGVQRQVPISVNYKGVALDEGFRADPIAEELVLVELKSVEKVSAAHAKQVQTYLRLTGLRLGYLLNFGEALMKDGITRCVNGLSAER